MIKGEVLQAGDRVCLQAALNRGRLKGTGFRVSTVIFEEHRPNTLLHFSHAHIYISMWHLQSPSVDQVLA